MQNIRWSTWRTSYGEYKWRPNATGDQTPNQITRSLLAGHTFVRLIKATLKRFMVVCFSEVTIIGNFILTYEPLNIF
ncbi:hypothetical protein Anas_06536 [Armadillidium nasatum]|uniref:Uncharacterized protein n=1 Tax=Armadillidium nasatum TaxID=96803 RepID=A0A5N5T7J6_9CRUS|nr:hypothetical protein Anas_06536 [Armadillidium nasatum]